jgi:predicted O-linked N-acetylglucosamine transferase (SPINDLY family)
LSTKNHAQALKAAIDLHGAGRLAQAEKAYRRVLAREPNRADAAYMFGVLSMALGRLEDAIELFGRAARSDPTKAAYHANLGEALRRARNYLPAKEALLMATTLQTDLFAPAYNLGLLFQEVGDVEASVSWYRRALAINPAAPAALGNLANALTYLHRFDEAFALFQKAIALEPSPMLYSNFGNALARAGRLDEARAAFRAALELKPDYAECHSNLLYNMHFGAHTAREIAEEARDWDRAHGAPLAPRGNSHHKDRSPQRRLRIGYVSPDFRHHCQAFFMFPLLSQHDHTQFEIFCYSDVDQPDEWTGRLLGHADHATSIYGQTDARVAGRIRDDRIDILVDLTMHMERNRLRVFARKPAPLQVCWLAYPGTTGLATIDYRVTDIYLEPPETAESPYSEKPLALPETFWCYHPLTSEDRVSALPALTNGHIRFGCLNNFCKINQAVVELWAKVLHAVAGSRLVVLVPEGEAREAFFRAFERLGIERLRIEPVGFRARLPYLATYRSIDVCLDTFPYGGHTTSLDALWMGAPVVTLVGPTVVGRAGLCHAMNLDLPELVASTPDQYVSIAARLCGDLAALSSLRQGLRGRMEKSPLMDASRFARNLEAAFRRAWVNYCGQPSSAATS